MKKINKNIFVFLFCFIFIGIGFCSKELLIKTGDAVLGFINGNSSISYRIDKIKNRINATYQKELFYHKYMLDINSLKENLLGTRVIFKDDTTIVKADSGSLAEPKPKMKESEFENVISELKKLKSITESNGADFLYCFAPNKELYETLPVNVNYWDIENCEKLLSYLDSASIPYVDLKKSLNKKGVSEEEIFYYTDHHWNANSGFIAATSICEELNIRYGFEFNDYYTDINNYEVKHFSNLFLGSRGKSTGLYFSQHGADDFDLITPRFDTDMTEEQPFKNSIRRGSFEDTVLFMENMEKDYYGLSTYTTYSGGDFRLQIMKNNLNPEGKRILLIRDSFACVVAPFLALQTSELHICDMRDFSGFVGDKVNVEEYIKTINPDYVLVLYTGISSHNISQGKYDFF